MLKKIVQRLGIFKHNFVKIGGGVIYRQSCTIHECIKCGTTVFVPKKECLIPNYMRKGCSKK